MMGDIFWRYGDVFFGDMEMKGDEWRWGVSY
jgi:hypothetical protein